MFLFAAVEDFAITRVDALPLGTSVVALRRGGAAETVAGPVYAQPTVVLFDEKPPQAIVTAIEGLELRAVRIHPAKCVLHAARYGAAAFDRRFGRWVDPEWARCTGDAAPRRGTARATSGRAGAA